MDTGCFVQLTNFRGKEGLVHVSQIANRRISNTKDFVKRDQEVYVKVISVSVDDRRPEESRGKQRKAIPGCRRENQSDPVVAAAREMVLQTLLLPLLQTLLLPLQERQKTTG
ncbi:putative pre-mRNA-splicing factor ATP-dependent RNA helicase DEAH5 [Camellia lanceoleosa]|uniref:Pre-mRNA-splicing factor ATP-dependent RNA helicase DEAH5 n=1 Tax=Camellia lanceoleosa TaxID=1840588 RepID=A0ACC0HVI1_9ERIC|nr:putative pre-mRNA-splicing factor ATP-dependent RNA helicase DEAH5 [Camellia lanceoleosa]